MSFVRSLKVKRTRKLGPKQKAGDQARGFALIVVLLLMLLLSAVSIGLMFMATNEGKVGGGDVQNNLAFHAAEGALEKMTVDLATQMTNMQSPQLVDINTLGAKTKPADSGGVFYLSYQFTAQPDPKNPTAPASTFGQITGGPNDGLYAQVIPVQLSAVVQTGMGAQVNMTRSVEIALIPAFQFGVFSQGDLGFYSSPNLTFNGRVHTNGDLYLGVSNGATVNFGDKLSAYGNVIRTVLPNGLSSTNANYNNNGTVLIPTASTGCAKAVVSATCRALLMTEGSIDPLVSLTAQNTNPKFTVTAGLYNGYLTDGNNGQPGGTGAILLTMPFTGSDPNNPTAQPAKPFEIIRRPPGPAIEDPTGPVAAARLANQAQIRVLLSDTPQENHLDGSAVDNNDVQLVSQVPSTLTALYTPPAGATTAQNGITVGGQLYYFGESKSGDNGLQKPVRYHGASFPGAASEWPLIDGFLRVEYKDAAGIWHPITNEWLSLGFARDSIPPKVVGGNLVHPKAILLFQELADRNNVGNTVGVLPTGLNSQYNFYPINFYDAREGELRDVSSTSDTTAAVNGVMNAVEIDVGNLRRWFLDKTSSGSNVDYVKENGYILYFSDRRGMLPNPNNGNVMQGEYGFEDVINSGNSSVNVDGVLEAPTAGCPPANPNSRPVSPEDVNGNCKLDNYGATNVGEAFGVNTNTNPPNPYVRVDAINTGRKNRVTGARHVLKLIDGGLGNLPTRLDNNAGGFTVASENPVYIWGDYNTNAADTTWIPVTPPAVPAEQPHSAAAVIADAVTLLSSAWSDPRSFSTPSNTAVRPAITTSYRVAIAAGKNLAFPAPKWIVNAQYGYGTDGGVHNFLRFLEDWSNDTLNYKGSMVSLYYATYNTGTFKCCNSAVYHPPVRNYQFDEMFITAGGLPPGTPMFRDVNNLSYRQDFTPDAAPATKY